MHYFSYRDKELYCEDVPVSLIADQVGTPLYLYSRKTLERHYGVFEEPFSLVDHIICFSVKACSNLTILRLFANLGAGMDIVSGGELFRALKAGVDPGKIVYSGVGKKTSEIEEALAADILMFNVESEDELHLLDHRAQALGKKARIALRVNPDVDPRTHPYISTGLKTNKFGIDVDKSLSIYETARKMKGVDPVGVACHIGSQLTELTPFLDTVERLRDLIGRLRCKGIEIRFLDIGGGLGIPYDSEEPPLPNEYGEAIIEKLSDAKLTLILEPGRILAGNSGILVTRVLYRKQGVEKNFVVCDAAMNDLMRPSLYDAHHSIWSVKQSDARPSSDSKIVADLVGPVCESGDFFARSREMDPVIAGDLLAIMSAGAYGFSMSSNYNSRVRAAEVLVDGNDFFVIRDRETYEDLVRGERIPSAILDIG
jgi:diaminopimelate decarboxylase